MRAQGFTLIELLITVVILGILTALAAPSMGDYIVQERVRGALINLKQELGYARSEAIKRNEDIYVASQQGADWCVGISTTDNCDCSISDPEEDAACVLPINGTRVLRRLHSDDYPGVILDEAKSFYFDGTRGLPYDSGSFSGTIEMSSGDYEGGVVISRIGRVKACGNISGMEGC